MPEPKRLEWNERYSVGIPAVDHEHREIIELINTLVGRIVESPASEENLEYLGEIYARIAAHFALEEKIMREAGYDEYADHSSDHGRLLDDIREMMDEYEDRRAFDAEAFVERLDRWFGDHFRTRDARLHGRLGVF
jgi:hemerythrin-like metal-binding protein